jgi:peptide-methionine (R)-S-oxide reductase
MLSRRNLLLAGLSAAAMGAVAFRATQGSAGATPGNFEVTKTDEEWKKQLTPEQFYVLRKHGTERAFTSPLDKEYGAGSYACAGCDAAGACSARRCTVAGAAATWVTSSTTGPSPRVCAIA